MGTSDSRVQSSEPPGVREGVFLYERVSAQFVRLISSGGLGPGDKLPSLRKLSAERGISLATATQAYAELEARGYIEARPQSGYYVLLNSRLMPPEPKMAAVTLSAAKVGASEMTAALMRAERHPAVVQLGMAAPGLELLPAKQLTRLASAICRSNVTAGVAYDFPPGHLPLRRQIARRSVEWAGSLAPDDILTTNGAMEALELCLRAVAGPGAIIAVESPTFFGLLQAIESLGMLALEIPTHPRDGMSLSALRDAINRHRIEACLSVPNFNNPMGSLMPDENKRELVRLLSKHGIPLIEDDIYGELYFGTKRPSTAKAYDEEGLVLLCSSFSKTVAPGYRVGWIVPGVFMDRVMRLKSMTSIATASLPQMIIAEYLNSSGYDRHMRRLRKAFSFQVDRVSAEAARHFPKGTRIARPQGGFVLWIEMPPSVDSIELQREALRQGISVAPGPIFSAKKKYRNYLRLNCGQTWSPKIEKAIRTVGRVATSLA